MAAYRGYMITMAICVAAEFGLYYGLDAVGAAANIALGVLMIWLCITCVLTGLIGEHFYPEEDDDRGD